MINEEISSNVHLDPIMWHNIIKKETGLAQ